MARPRKNDTHLPERLYKQTTGSGTYTYAFRGSWHTMGSDEAWAIDMAKELNALSPSERQRVLEDLSPDNFLLTLGDQCVYCGTEDANDIDHFVPTSIGGPDEEWNRLPCCRACNSSKGSKHPMLYLRNLARAGKWPPVGI